MAEAGHFLHLLLDIDTFSIHLGGARLFNSNGQPSLTMRHVLVFVNLFQTIVIILLQLMELVLSWVILVQVVVPCIEF